MRTLAAVLLMGGALLALTEAHQERVEVGWGIPDTTATVGRVFRLHIPSDAFRGPVKSYTAKTADGGPLPPWLRHDPVNFLLEGLPTHANQGQIFLEVTANGENSDDHASVVFSLLVRDVASHTSGAPLRFVPQSSPHSPQPEVVRCKSSEPETVATLVLDADLESLSVEQRLQLIERFANHMGLHMLMVKVVPVAGKSMQDGSALVSGVGDTPHAAPQTSGTFMSWPVGCGQVKEGHFPALQRLDDDSANGQMAKALSFPIIGWHVTNSRLQAPKRKRRAANYATATLVATPVMPTKTITEQGESTDKMTHTVVDRVSPTFIQPTATHTPMEKSELPVVPPAVSSKPVDTKPTPPLPPMEKTEDQIKPSQTEMPVKPSETVKPPVVTPGDKCVKGQPPRKGKEIKKLTYTVGDIIDYTFAEDAFEDCEVGGTRGLTLDLFAEGMTVLPGDFVIKFEQDKQRIIGLPRAEQAKKYKLTLVASKGDMRDNIDFVLNIKPLKGKAQEKINHELSMGVDYDYDKFISSIDDQLLLSNNIASVFGDPDASNILVTKLERGSVIYGWTNKSLSSGGCPTDGIGGVVNKMMDDDGNLTPEAIEKLKPFVLTSVASRPAGNCEGNPSFPNITSLPRTDLQKPDSTTEAGTDKSDKTTKGDENVAKGSAGDDDDGDDKLLTTVVPGIVIVVVLVIGLIIGCVLYRRKRKGNMNVEEKNTFINQHPPVIFPDELDEKPSNDVNKPLLLTETGPNTSAAGPPPEYHRGASESPDRPPGPNNGGAVVSNGRHDDPDDITEMPERPYDPPPPVTSTGGSGKTPRPAQQPFSQPPQILP